MRVVLPFSGGSGELFAPSLTGFIIQKTGTYRAAFVVTGVLGVAGALAVLLFVRYRSYVVKEGVVVNS